MQPTPPPGAESAPAEAFLRTVLRSGLLGRSRLREAIQDVPRARRHDPRALAGHLVRGGHLTPFQAGKLLRGTFRGLVLGPYRVLAPLGKGGMGTVYLARDGDSGEYVALKILPPHKARGEDRLLARFRREMEMSRRVAHPNLAWTYDAGQYHGVYFIAMEYIPGCTLTRLVAEQGPLSVERAAGLLAEVAAALEHVHNQGLVHRDLKPSNIMVTPNGHAKVLDLGLALVAGERAADPLVVGGRGYVLGTMDYIAPEQARDPTAVDRRADVYSLGCTLYFALTGRPPFPGGTSREKIHRQKHEEPTPLRVVLPNVLPPFAAVVRRMMEKDPADRYPSAAAVEEELRGWGPPGPGRPMDRPGDPAYAAAVAAVRDAEPSTEADAAELSFDGQPTGIVPDWALELGSVLIPPALRRRPRGGWVPEFLRNPVLILIALLLASAVVIGLLTWRLLTMPVPAHRDVAPRPAAESPAE
jgi:serine/threonine protein kinase